MEGKKAKDSLGIIDPNLFKPGPDSNKLHAVMNPDTCLWTMKYEKGDIPPALKGTFTGFRVLKKHVDNYFTHRNIVVKEVKD
jgi:hypothetical protein